MIYSVPTTSISFSAMKTWSPSYSSNSNISLQTLLENMYPDDTAPYSLSTIRGSSIRYGYVSAGMGGNIAVTYPYSSGQTTGHTITPISSAGYSTVTLVAYPTYPATFHSWRTLGMGGGSSISTSQTLSMSFSQYTTQSAFYAHFNV